MNPRLKKNFSALLILLPVGVLLMPSLANAGWWDLLSPGDIMFTVLAWIANQAMTIAAWYLSVCGLLLNGAITATLNIKDLVAGSGGVIGATWTTLRDLSSIAIIFMLLWSSISIIIDIKGPKFNTLIKDIFLVGLLINFSLFFTNIAVDASNLVSLSFYRAITPAYVNIDSAKGIDWKAAMDGGISNVFMQSLEIQQIYAPSKQLKGSNPKLNIIIAGIGGTVLMLMAGTSFVFAAFAPVYFIGWIVPEVDKYSKLWWTQLRAQCLFMPVYLAFLYVAMRIINAPNFMHFLNPSGQSTDSGSFSTLPYLGGTTGVILQYVVAIFMINIPLWAAMDVGGKGAEWGQKYADKFNDWAKGVGKGAATTTGAFIGRQTGGRFGQWADDKLDGMNIGGSNPIAQRVGQWARAGTTGALAGATYGGKKGFKDTKKEWDKTNRETNARYTQNDNVRILDANIKKGAGSVPFKNSLKEIKDKAALGKERLTNISVLKWLKSADFEAIKKSDEYTEADIKEITGKRYEALMDSILTSDRDAIKNMVDNMSADELVKTLSIDGAKDALKNPYVIGNLTETQLRNMQEKIDDTDIKDAIRIGINEWDTTLRAYSGGKKHKSFG
ncbi:hypothetical protein EB052_01705, partial [bacterium]|nr:hypothetical protein [bacterium]